jgi:hypothetical protein
MTRLNSWSHLIRVAAIGCAVATCGSVAHAQTGGQSSLGRGPDRACSNATLQGAYAFDVVGVFVDAPTPLPLRGVAVTQFDGTGNLTQVDHVVFNGTPPPVDWTPGTGWYQINADCTGQMQIDIPGSPFSPVILRLSVGANGTHINTVVSKPGFVVSSTGTKVEQKEKH